MNHNELMQQASSIAGETVRLLEARGNSKAADKVRSLRFRWNKRLTITAGRAKILLGIVELSWAIFGDLENQSGFRNTVLHEIAHHLAPPEYSHRQWKKHHALWRYTFRAIGGNGRTCHSFKVKPRTNKGTKEFDCPGCCDKIRMGATQMRRMAAGTRYFCRKCKTELKYRRGSVDK